MFVSQTYTWLHLIQTLSVVWVRSCSLIPCVPEGFSSYARDKATQDEGNDRKLQSSIFTFVSSTAVASDFGEKTPVAPRVVRWSRWWKYCLERLGWKRFLWLQLRTVRTIVIAHAFCASRDTRIAYRWCSLIQGYFCAVQGYAEKAELSKWSWYPKRKLGVTSHFSEIINLQFGKKRHTLPCILNPFTNIVDYLSSKNAWLPPIFFLDFNNTC